MTNETQIKNAYEESLKSLGEKNIDTPKDSSESDVSVPKKEKPKLNASTKINAIIPTNIEEAYRMAESIYMSGIIPDSYKGRAQDNLSEKQVISRIMIGIQTSLEVGLPPMMGLKNIMIINNTPSIWGDAAVALVQSRGLIEYVKCEYLGTIQGGDRKCSYVMKRKGQEGEYIGCFSLDQAKKAGLMNKRGNIWLNYTDRMLMNRARAYAIRDGFADCLNGLSIAEEMDSIEKQEEATVEFLEE